MSRVPLGCTDCNELLIEHARKQHLDANTQNRRDQNHWQNAVALLRAEQKRIYINKKGKGDPVGLPAGLDQRIRDNLIRVMRGDLEPSTFAGAVGNVESSEVPLTQQPFFVRRSYKDSCYGLLASMYEQTRVQDTKLTQDEIEAQASKHLRDDIQFNFNHRTRQQGAWKAKDELVEKGFVSEVRSIGRPSLYCLTKMGYKMCYLLFHVKDFGSGPRPRPTGCHVTKDGDVIAGPPPAHVDPRPAPVVAASASLIRSSSFVPTSSRGYPDLALDRVPQQNLALAALHQQRALSHIRPAPDPHALLNARNANFKVSSSDDEECHFRAAIAESLLSQAPHSQMRTNDSFHLPNLKMSSDFLQKKLGNRDHADKVTALLPGVTLGHVEQSSLKPDIFNFSSRVRSQEGVSYYTVKGQWDSTKCKHVKSCCDCPVAATCCKHLLATLVAYAKRNHGDGAAGMLISPNRFHPKPLVQSPQHAAVCHSPMLHQQRALSHIRPAPDPHALLNARNANFKVSSSDDEECHFRAAIAESLLSQAPHSQMRTNDSFHLPNLKMSIAFKEPQQQPAQIHVQLTPLCQQQQRPPPSPIPRTLNMVQSDVIVLDSDDEIDASPMLQPTSAFMESDSLEFLGTENPNEWNSAADDAIDLFEQPVAASECFPYRERVPHDAQVATLMCKTERVQQNNYRDFYYGAVRTFEIHGQGRVHNDRKLPLGDFQFHYQCSGDNPDEPSLASDVVIERKTINDIVTSSAGDRDSSGTARHIRQESRLRHCKLTRACMLIEGIPDSICPHLPGPRTSHDRQLQNPDCLHTKEDVMNYQAQVVARSYASNQVFVLQSPNEQHSQLLLAAISQILAAPSDQPREAFQVSRFDEFCRQQCRATSKMQAKLSREGVHCELLARLARRYPDEQSVVGVLEACSRPLDRAQLFQHLQVAGSNQDCKLLQTMPPSEYTKEEAAKSGAIIYKTLFGSTILPQPSHKQTCSSAETQVMGSSHAIKACVDDPANLPPDSGIRVHRDDTECDSDCADVLRCWSQNCCSSSQAIHVSIAHGVDVLQLFLQAIQDWSTGEADEKKFCMAVALGVGKQVIRPLVAAQQRWAGGKPVTSLLVLEDVVNGNGGACIRFKKRVAQSQANGDSRCQLENGSDFPMECVSLFERNIVMLFMLMEAYLLVRHGFHVRHSKNRTDTHKFIHQLQIELKLQAPLLHPAIPSAPPVSVLTAVPRAAAPQPSAAARDPFSLDDSPPLPPAQPPKQARKRAVSRPSASARAARDPFSLDDSPPLPSAQPPKQARKRAAPAVVRDSSDAPPDACVIESHELPKKKRQARTQPSPFVATSSTGFETHPSLSSTMHSQGSACCATPMSPRSHQLVDSAVDSAAMQELIRVLEDAKVVPECSRQLFAASMIRCGVSSLEALRESLSEVPAELDLDKDVEMNPIQRKCLLRWLQLSA